MQQHANQQENNKQPYNTQTTPTQKTTPSFVPMGNRTPRLCQSSNNTLTLRQFVEETKAARSQTLQHNTRRCQQMSTPAFWLITALPGRVIRDISYNNSNTNSVKQTSCIVVISHPSNTMLYNHPQTDIRRWHDSRQDGPIQALSTDCTDNDPVVGNDSYLQHDAVDDKLVSQSRNGLSNGVDELLLD